MLASEWRELETLCDRISDLRHRYAAAQRSKNVGLLEGLKDDLVKARRNRERLVQHISACLSSVVSERRYPPSRRARGREEGAELPADADADGYMEAAG
jgi:hypothetical protein